MELVEIGRSFLPVFRLLGFSAGRWEGEELVIHTTNYAPGLLGGDGLRQYGEMSVVERYRLVNGVSREKPSSPRRAHFERRGSATSPGSSIRTG